MRQISFVIFFAAALASCGGGGSAGTNPAPNPTTAPTSGGTPVPYQPLAVGDQWTYACGQRGQSSTFTKTNSVTGTQTVNGVTVFDFALQIVTSPTQITTETMLLANDAQGNLTLYGYLVNGAVQTITPTIITPLAPTATNYNYPAPDGSTVSRVFMGVENSNPTPYNGVNRVAAYFESNATHNYGYALGLGIAEEDHGPNYQYDCLLSAVTLH